jgi:hypothetical protein
MNEIERLVLAHGEEYAEGCVSGNGLQIRDVAQQRRDIVARKKERVKLLSETRHLQLI